VTLRLEMDTEYLYQCVLRDQVSSYPWKKHWDVQEKAIKVARKLGQLDYIKLWYATMIANTVRARAEESCPATGNEAESTFWYFTMAVFICGAILGCFTMYFIFKHFNTPRAMQNEVSRTVQVRSIAVQSQTTYTELRGSPNPRFHPLPQDSHGVFH
jgi:hypothetical protein